MVATRPESYAREVAGIVKQVSQEDVLQTILTASDTMLQYCHGRFREGQLWAEIYSEYERARRRKLTAEFAFSLYKLREAQKANVSAPAVV
jgi:hypothetical protein